MNIKTISTKMTHGESAIYGVAKLYVSPREKEGELHKALIAGVILTEDSLTPTLYESGYEIERMYECEVIIIPKLIYEEDTYNGRGARIDQILTCGFGHPSNYKREIPIKNK